MESFHQVSFQRPLQCVRRVLFHLSRLFPVPFHPHRTGSAFPFACFFFPLRDFLFRKFSLGPQARTFYWSSFFRHPFPTGWGAKLFPPFRWSTSSRFISLKRNRLNHLFSLWSSPTPASIIPRNGRQVFWPLHPKSYLTSHPFRPEGVRSRSWWWDRRGSHGFEMTRDYELRFGLITLLLAKHQRTFFTWVFKRPSGSVNHALLSCCMYGVESPSNSFICPNGRFSGEVTTLCKSIVEGISKLLQTCCVNFQNPKKDDFRGWHFFARKIDLGDYS